MKQIIQNYRTGKFELAEVPIPLASMGTESSIIKLGQKSLLGKAAKARPDLDRRFMDKVKKLGEQNMDWSFIGG